MDTLSACATGRAAPWHRLRRTVGAVIVAAAALWQAACSDGAGPPTTGAIAFTISGLDAGTNADIVVVGPDGTSRPVTAGGTLPDLPPGSYTITARGVRTARGRLGPRPATQQVVVIAGQTATAAPIAYVEVPTMIDVTITGLPTGATGRVFLTQPGGSVLPVLTSARVDPATPGRWLFQAASLVGTEYTFNPRLNVTDTTLLAGDTLFVIVAYEPISGALSVTTPGLPPGIAANMTLSGPGGFTRAVNAAGTVPDLTPGSYTLTAIERTTADMRYTPVAGSRTVTVLAGLTVPVTVDFTATPTVATNFTVEHVHLTQATQRLEGGVTLVGGRDALLRVFVKANRANTLRPEVRIRAYQGSTLQQTWTVQAPEASVRTELAEGVLASTWNVLVPGTLVRPDLRILVDADPTAALPDADRSDNVWPRGGTPQVVPVINVPAFNVRFVPVTVGTLTGAVSEANVNGFLQQTRLMAPVHVINTEIRAPFTSSATSLDANDSNNAWTTVLGEINALRATDGAPTDLHYYGVLKVTYTSGVAGYGYVPGRAAIGWDYLPSGGLVAVHEWGHNFGRPHTPCGVAGDPQYPYPNGTIGHWGWNALTNVLVPPTATDYMSYCSNQWTSDWTWTRIMNYRGNAGASSAATGAGGDATGRGTPDRGRDGGLLVWGRVVDGRVLLEPAFRVDAPPTPAVAGATLRAELLDAAGTPLLELPIEAARVDHAFDRDERHFAVVLPWSPRLEAALAQVRVRDVRAPLSTATRASASIVSRGEVATGRVAADAVPLPDPEARITRTGSRARLEWNARDYPMALVRDAATGEVMGFVRQPGAAVETAGRRVEVVVSDGVRSRVVGERN
jgi:hypothetical protein